jgi:hypothetical protein
VSAKAPGSQDCGREKGTAGHLAAVFQGLSDVFPGLADYPILGLAAIWGRRCWLIRAGSMEWDSELVEAIARRVVELLGGSPQRSGVRLVDATAVADALGVERDWVYAHADQLGAVRLGGPKGRLRFDLRAIDEQLADGGPHRIHGQRSAPRPR